MTFRLWSLSFLFISSIAWGSSPDIGLARLQKQLLAENPELKASSEKIEASSFQSQSNQGSFFPVLSLNAGYAEEKTANDFDQGYVGYIAGNWNLFHGGKDWQQWKISKNETKLEEVNYEITKRRLERELAEIYFDALLNTHLISLDTEKLQLLKNQRAMAQRKINAGLTSEVDALELDLEEATLAAEIEAHKMDLQNSLLAIQVLFNNKITIENIDIESFPQVSMSDFSLANLEQSPLLQKQRLLTENSQLEYRQEFSNYLPTIDVELQYGRLIPQYLNPTQGSESKASILLTWTFFSGLSTHYQTANKSKLNKVRTYEAQQIQQQVQGQLTLLRNKAQERLHYLNLLKKRQVATQKYYNLTLSEYKRGIKNSSDLASATRTLFENKTKLLEAQKELAIIKLKFDEINNKKEL